MNAVLLIALTGSLTVFGNDFDFFLFYRLGRRKLSESDVNISYRSEILGSVKEREKVVGSESIIIL